MITPEEARDNMMKFCEEDFERYLLFSNDKIRSASQKGCNTCTFEVENEIVRKRLIKELKARGYKARKVTIVYRCLNDADGVMVKW